MTLFPVPMSAQASRHMNLLRTILIALVLWFVLSVAAHAGDKVLDIKSLETPSGLSFWMVEDHTAPVIALSFAFHQDAEFYGAKDQGITTYLTTMLDEGAGDYDSQAFQKMLEDYNISMSFDGGRDSFDGAIYMLSKYKDKGAEMLRLAITAPRFDAEPMERMRRASITSLRRRLGDPAWARARLTNEYSYPGHYYALNSGGTLATLSGFSADDLRAFTKRYFTRDALKISVAGDLTPDEAIVLVDSIFSALPKVAQPYTAVQMPTFPENPDIVFFAKDIPQTYLRLVWDGIDNKDPDYSAFVVMNYILGGGGFSSRLMSEIREKRGLTYGIYSSMMSNDKADRLHIDASTAHDNVTEMRTVTLAEINRMVAEPVGAQELADAKSYLTGSMVLGLTSTSSIAGAVAGLLYNDRPIDWLDGYKDRVNAVTAADVQRVAKRLFEGKTPLEIYVGQKPDLGPQLNARIKTVDTLPNAE